jgi:hypothetical protein
LECSHHQKLPGCDRSGETGKPIAFLGFSQALFRVFHAAPPGYSHTWAATGTGQLIPWGDTGFRLDRIALLKMDGYAAWSRDGHEVRL